MADPRAMTRVLDELLWALRRAGIVVSIAQAIDAARVAHAVGFQSSRILREALAAVVVLGQRDRRRFDDVFDTFFARDRSGGTLWERLATRGFTDAELSEL